MMLMSGGSLPQKLQRWSAHTSSRNFSASSRVTMGSIQQARRRDKSARREPWPAPRTRTTADGELIPLLVAVQKHQLAGLQFLDDRETRHWSQFFQAFRGGAHEDRAVPERQPTRSGSRRRGRDCAEHWRWFLYHRSECTVSLPARVRPCESHPREVSMASGRTPPSRSGRHSDSTRMSRDRAGPREGEGVRFVPFKHPCHPTRWRRSSCTPRSLLPSGRTQREVHVGRGHRRRGRFQRRGRQQELQLRLAAVGVGASPSPSGSCAVCAGRRLGTSCAPRATSRRNRDRAARPRARRAAHHRVLWRESLHEQSHGESFSPSCSTVLGQRFYVLDEPERRCRRSGSSRS